jgi:hypothetical protein
MGCDGLQYRLGNGASPDRIAAAEARLAVHLPGPVRQFYAAFDGLCVDEPPFEILRLADIERHVDLLVFCWCDGGHRLAFDTSSINNAGQWFIVNADTGYRVTYTMASFWTTRMWTWIGRRVPIWLDAHASSANP